MKSHWLSIVSVLVFTSCATLKPLDSSSNKGYLLAPTNTIERLYDNAKADYRFRYRFGFINQETNKIRYFTVKGNDSKHAVLSALEPGNYMLYSEQRRYGEGNGDKVELLPDTIYPRYKPLEFSIASGRVTVLPWYFGIAKTVAPQFDQDSEGAESRELKLIELCENMQGSNRTWYQEWNENIPSFNEYLLNGRVVFGDIVLPSKCD